MDKNQLVELRNKIGFLPALEYEESGGDTIGVALVEYYSRHADCPATPDDYNDQTGYYQWAMDQADDALERIVLKLIETRLFYLGPSLLEWKVDEALNGRR